MSYQQMGYDQRREQERLELIRGYWSRRGHQVCGAVSVNPQDSPTPLYTTATDMKNGCPVGHPANQAGTAS
ncbi:hypothetical protein [Pseudovibrio sp. Tun.PSC04-5.I4]|uniref:hypothetical protein n=1 Tax=Pseudovibrio sp. Tun.PSC04-5.I4 TaxID=1798213 RepID=UPI0008891FE8|nr:hypothetical protein [Pseudovibrio sp. Tun.PSC04-5.I4]SDQ17928.1 hypothetical protein SAMN04515695_0346 [Pseudovibrio sp. Tun.PSC04-5.I4]